MARSDEAMRLGPDPLYQDHHRQDPKEAESEEPSGREPDALDSSQDAQDQSAGDEEEFVLHGLAQQLALVVAQPDFASFPAGAIGTDEEHDEGEEHPQREAPPVVHDREPQGEDGHDRGERAGDQRQPTPVPDVADQPADGQQESVDPQCDLSRQRPDHACRPSGNRKPARNVR